MDMDQQETRWNNMSEYFFVDYNNGHEKTYTFFSIEKKYDDIDWEEFINKIRTTRFTGCTPSHFQKALQEAGIFFTSSATIKQEKFDRYMEVPFNRTHYKILKHHNIGNY